MSDDANGEPSTGQTIDQRLAKPNANMQSVADVCLIWMFVQQNESVERFVYGVDANLRRQHEQQKLSSIVSRIESYDAIDCNNDEAEKVWFAQMVWYGLMRCFRSLITPSPQPKPSIKTPIHAMISVLITTMTFFLEHSSWKNTIIWIWHNPWTAVPNISSDIFWSKDP